MDIYDELGVRKIINGSATLTMLGGSIMPSAVVEAMASASRAFVNIDELQACVGRLIAEWTQNEACYISCGAAAGLVLSTAACIAGADPEKRARLPFTDGMKNEIIIHRRGRVGYDFAIRQAGGKLVEIGTPEGASADELEAAITPRTTGIFVFYNDHFTAGQVPLAQQIEIAHRHGLPVVDAAAQIPPAANLWRFTQMGADLVLFSGGKGLRGPQSSGLVLGRRDLIEACAFNGCPRPFIGRPMKAGKEEIVGLMAAVRWTLDQDEDEMLRLYEAQVAWILDAFSGVAGITARRSFPSEAGQPMPRAEIILDEAALGLRRDDLLARLMQGNPAVSLAPADECGVFVNPQTLEPGQEKVIVERMRALLASG